MTPPEPADAELEAVLRSSAPSPLPDGGFTGRVLASLPPATRPSPWWRLQWVFIALGAGVGIAFVSSMLPHFEADLGGATITLGALLDEPGAVLALAAIAVAWSLTAGEEAVE